MTTVISYGIIVPYFQEERKVEKMPLEYSIDVLAALKEAGYSQNSMLNNRIFGSGTLTKLRRGEPIQWEIIERICELLNCQPSDFLEYIPEEK